MIHLKLGNSMSQLTGLTVAQFKEVKDLLSYDIGSDAAYFSGSTYNTKRTLLSKRGEFPSGLRGRLFSWLKGHDFTAEDTRRQPVGLPNRFSLKLGDMTPYLEQVDAVDHAAFYRQGTVSMVTGFGKSLTMALLVHRMQVKTLIVVPNLTLKTQLKETFKKYFGNLDNVTIENIDSKALETKGDYDMLIIDEAHHVAAKTYRKLNTKCWGGIYYRYFFTATPFRNNDEEQLLMESIAGNVIYSVDYHKGVKAKAIVPVEGYYFVLPKTKMKGDDRDWATVYKELVVDNDERTYAIVGMLISFQGGNKSALCLVKEIRHGEKLSKITGIPFANGKDGKSAALIRHFNDGGLNLLIGTAGVVGEGVDIKSAEYVILASSGKAKSQFMQNVGRVLRRFEGKESGKVIMFKDPSHKWLTKHFNACMGYLRDEYGVEAVKL